MDGFLGEIRMFAGNYVPEDWAGCDGTMMQVSQYEALFSLLGTTYGGDGIKTFALPDLRGRIPVGQGQGTDLTNRVVGQSFGDIQVTLTEANLPAHTHAIIADGAAETTTCDASGHLWGQSITGSTTAVYSYTDGAASPAPATISMGQGLVPYGASGAHQNLQPYAVITMIIALQGTYPPRP